MNKSTENDLSYNTAIFDFNALKKTATYAVVKLKQLCYKELTELNIALESNNVTSIHLTAERLKDTVSKLDIAADTYAVILGAESRKEIIIKR